MTALEWIIKEAKSLKKKFPKRYSTWKEYVAQASAIYANKHKGKSPVGKKKSKIGAAGDYAKFEIETIKSLSKILRKSLKYTQQLVNNNQNILNIISNSFDEKLTPLQTAKIIKEELTPTTKENKLKAFVDILSKGQKSKSTGSKNFPMKLPATVTIGALPINFTGSFLGYRFSVYNQYRIDGGVTAVLLDIGKNKIGELNGRKEEEERTINALFVNSITYNKTQHQQPFYLGQKEEKQLKEKIKKFVVQLNKEVKDYNSGKNTKLKKTKPVKYTATVKKLSLINEIKKLLYDNKKILKGGYTVKPGQVRNFSPSEISGIPHKSQYFIQYKYNGINKIEYFEKYPVGYYKGMDRIIYVMRLTDQGTALIPLQTTKTNAIVKK